MENERVPRLGIAECTCCGVTGLGNSPVPGVVDVRCVLDVAVDIGSISVASTVGNPKSVHTDVGHAWVASDDTSESYDCE